MHLISRTGTPLPKRTLSRIACKLSAERPSSYPQELPRSGRSSERAIEPHASQTTVPRSRAHPLRAAPIAPAPAATNPPTSSLVIRTRYAAHAPGGPRGHVQPPPLIRRSMSGDAFESLLHVLGPNLAREVGSAYPRCLLGSEPRELLRRSFVRRLPKMSASANRARWRRRRRRRRRRRPSERGGELAERARR